MLWYLSYGHIFWKEMITKTKNTLEVDSKGLSKLHHLLLPPYAILMSEIN